MTQVKTEPTAVRSQAGLADIVATDSSICFIDGVKGRLVYRGYDVADLAEHSTFREAAYLLWYGKLPTRKELAPFQDLFTGALQLPMETIMVLKLLPRRATPMEVLRTGVSSLGNFDPDSGLTDPAAVQRKCTRLISRMMMLICAHDCVRRGQDPIEPKQGPHAGLQLPLHADRRAADTGGGTGHGGPTHPARRPRA